jgi:hypothetical protein
MKTSLLVCAVASLCTYGYAGPVPPSADLAGTTITLKLKCTAEGGCNVKNATFVFQNAGVVDADNSFVEFWLSDDTTLSTDTDTLVHRVATGKVKAGKSKKKTMGGGLLQQFTMNKHILGVLDADHTVGESNENNNVFASDPLPPQN